MLGALRCQIMGHKVDRRRVWHDGRNNRTTCRSCKQPLLRARDGWRLFDPENDGVQGRQPHPRTGEIY